MKPRQAAAEKKAPAGTATWMAATGMDQKIAPTLTMAPATLFLSSAFQQRRRQR